MKTRTRTGSELLILFYFMHYCRLCNITVACEQTHLDQGLCASGGPAAAAAAGTTAGTARPAPAARAQRAGPACGPQTAASFTPGLAGVFRSTGTPAGGQRVPALLGGAGNPARAHGEPLTPHHRAPPARGPHRPRSHHRAHSAV